MARDSQCPKLLKNGAPGEIRTPDPLVRSQMLYPAELRARHGTASGVSIIAETLPWLKVARTTDSGPRPKYFLSRDFNNLLAALVLPPGASVNLSQHWQFLPCACPSASLHFQAFGIGKSDATIIARRSGAQRGALEDKLRPEVFLDAPCIFPSPRFHLADCSPPQTAGWPLKLTPAPAFLGHPVPPAATAPQSPAL